MSKREAGKADRRKRIVDAARELIRETGDLSMRAIAANANVSLATPYNLFGSKRAIVVAVLDDRRDFGERFSKLKNVSAVDRIFKALAITLSYHVEEPEFYRTIWASLLDRAGSDELRAELITPQSALFWMNLLTEAVREGALQDDIDIALLHTELSNTFSGVMLRWVFGGCTADQLEPAMGYGYALTLAGAATDEARPKIRKRALEFQRRLRKMQKADASAA